MRSPLTVLRRVSRSVRERPGSAVIDWDTCPARFRGKVSAVVRNRREADELVGFYGHPDHVKIHHLTTEAFHQLARGRDNAARLYYTVVPKRAFRRMAEQMQATGAAMPSDFPPIDQMGTPDENVTTTIDVSSYWETKRQAMAAHRTQFGPDNPLLSLPEETLASFFSTEYFQRVFPAFKDAQQEKALF
ncbi:MAG: hypothetical protein IID55_12135 [Proteobacteria bacterium]|nr:hypothetical protein [Pseudomonadota bacterium]